MHLAKLLPIATIDTSTAKLLGYKEQLQQFLGPFTSSSILELNMASFEGNQVNVSTDSGNNEVEDWVGTVILHHDSRIENVVSPFSLVTQARLVKDPKTQRPKGFGFVSFRSEDEAKNALEAMNGRIVRGRLIFVEVANTESPENGDSSA
ncbi:hypothetical protein Q3G72_027066 [Acer saccharum]|nr:hypothetical protein Q3G72_027066 [Acer saccharum]